MEKTKSSIRVVTSLFLGVALIGMLLSLGATEITEAQDAPEAPVAVVQGA